MKDMGEMNRINAVNDHHGRRLGVGRGPRAKGLRRLRGFTLVELLAVIAIIGTLVGLLLPAVQSAREASRLATCSNNLKQIGVAMHTYHDAQKTLPPGWAGATFGTWFSLVMPFIEETRARSLYTNWGAETANAGWYRSTQNSQFCIMQFPGFMCPSDRPSTFTLSSTVFAKHNYVVNTGNTAVDKTNKALGPSAGSEGQSMTQTLNGVTFGGAPFVVVDVNKGTAGGVAFRQMIDGLSKTLMASETIQGKNPAGQYDLRGFVVWGNGTGFSAHSQPNSTTPDYMPEGCINSFGNNPPCATASTSTGTRNSARSLHQGGVNAVMCDGAVKFFTNDILVDTWRALSTTNGGETVDVQ